MNYELAQELKDAGFPQQAYIALCPFHTTHECLNGKKDCAYAPTLEELIEAMNAEPKRGMFFLAFEKHYWSA